MCPDNSDERNNVFPENLCETTTEMGSLFPVRNDSFCSIYTADTMTGHQHFYVIKYRFHRACTKVGMMRPGGAKGQYFPAA